MLQLLTFNSMNILYYWRQISRIDSENGQKISACVVGSLFPIFPPEDLYQCAFPPAKYKSDYFPTVLSTNVLLYVSSFVSETNSS